MTTRPDFVPPDYDFEEVEYGTVFKRELEPSILAPPAMQLFPVVECPGCHEKQPDNGIGTHVCRCGFNMRYHNNGAVIWRKPKAQS